jgi:hypothetical protein
VEALLLALVAAEARPRREAVGRQEVLLPAGTPFTSIFKVNPSVAIRFAIW